jgi:uncharacterized protein (DUF1786 family)
MLVLTVDVGAGTNDILLWDSEARGENQTHMVVPSSTRVVGQEIRQATRRRLAVLFRGPLMGGGASSAAMSRHLEQKLPFYAEEWAARTFSDDLDEVSGMGVTIVTAEEADRLASNEEIVPVRSGDLRLDHLERALRLLGETRRPDGYALAVQDHGQAPPGMSDREFRFLKLTEALNASRRLADLFYTPATIPAHFTRLAAAAACLGQSEPVVVADTGPAALWGAALTAREPDCLAINYGNGHTLMARVRDHELDGLFEHHTSALNEEKMARFLRGFAAGTLSGDEVFRDGGHGALPMSNPVDLEKIEILATGPNRGRFRSLGVTQVEASIHGDMMLSGCWGLLQGFLTRAGGGSAPPVVPRPSS